MRMSDWSSDVCSSDLILPLIRADDDEAPGGQFAVIGRSQGRRQYLLYLMCIWSGRNQIPWLCRAARKQIVDGRGKIVEHGHFYRHAGRGRDRKSVVEGKSVSVRVDLGGSRIIKKKKDRQQQ